VEKSLKAVLASREITYTRTHDLGELLDLLDDHGIPAPPNSDSLPELTPFAAEFRYGHLPPEAGKSPALDRQQALDRVRRARQWAQDTVAG